MSERERGPDGRLLPIPADRKKTIIDDAMASIMSGDRLDQIAARHSIATITLRKWLAQLGDEYAELRADWIDGKLIAAEDAIERADDPVSIAQARELWRSATWYAERRDARYRAGPSVAVQTNVQVVICKDDLDL